MTSIAEVEYWTTGLVALVIIPGEALCLMGLIVCKGTSRYLALLFGCSLLAALGASLISTSLAETFIPPTPLESFTSDGVMAVNPTYRPALLQLLCVTAVVGGAFVIAFHQMRRGRQLAGRGFLILAFAALFATAMWAWTMGSLYGYGSLLGG